MGLTRKQISTVAVLLIGTFVVVLNQTLLSPALASIMRDLSIDAPTVQWVMSIYSLVEAVVIPLSAFLIGRFSTRQLFITGLIISRQAVCSAHSRPGSSSCCSVACARLSQRESSCP